MTYRQKGRFQQLEAWGVAFTCLTGLLLHFSYRLSGGAVSKVMVADSNKIRPWFPAAALALALFIAMYLTFTVNPPHISLFLDSSTGTYGIPPRNLDAGAVYLDALKEI